MWMRWRRRHVIGKAIATDETAAGARCFEPPSDRPNRTRIARDHRIRRHERDALDLSLRDQHAVERVRVSRQARFGYCLRVRGTRQPPASDHSGLVPRRSGRDGS